MGVCASVQYSKNRATLFITNGSSTTAKVIHSIDGTLQEFRQPVKAGNVLSVQNFFLCNAENMYVNCHVPHVPEDENLQPGQIYFILPVSKLYRPISLHELCLLAIKASSVIETVETRKMSRTTSFSELVKKMSITTSLSDHIKKLSRTASSSDQIKKLSRTASFSEGMKEMGIGRTTSLSGSGIGRTTSLGGRRKRNGNSVKRNRNVDFQLALKQLG